MSDCSREPLGVGQIQASIYQPANDSKIRGCLAVIGLVPVPIVCEVSSQIHVVSIFGKECEILPRVTTIGTAQRSLVTRLEDARASHRAAMADDVRLGLDCREKRDVTGSCTGT